MPQRESPKGIVDAMATEPAVFIGAHGFTMRMIDTQPRVRELLTMFRRVYSDGFPPAVTERIEAARHRYPPGMPDALMLGHEMDRAARERVLALKAFAHSCQRPTSGRERRRQ